MSAHGISQIDDFLRRQIDDGQMVGGSVLVSRRGAVVYFNQFGWMDAEARKPMRPDTIVRIYSMSKPITSMAALILLDEGKIGLDDPVEKFLPELANRSIFDPAGNRPAKSRLTVRHLLLHTSGFVYGNSQGSAIQRLYDQADLLDKDGTLQDLVAKLSCLPLAFDPGERWEYGLSTDVLGAVIERASGQTLNDFLRQRIFVPLKMADTGFEVRANKLDRFAECYERRDNQWVVHDAAATSRFAKPATMYSGGGGLVSTATDYWRFLMMIAGGGKAGATRLLAAKTVGMMTSNQLDKAFCRVVDPGQAFGFGFRILVEPLPSAEKHLLGEYGWFGRASTSFWTNPRDEISVVVLEQSLPFSDKTMVAVQRLVHEAIDRPEGPTVPPAE